MARRRKPPVDDRWIAVIGAWTFGPLSYDEAKLLAEENGGTHAPLWDPKENTQPEFDLPTAIECAREEMRRRGAKL